MLRILGYRQIRQIRNKKRHGRAWIMILSDLYTKVAGDLF